MKLTVTKVEGNTHYDTWVTDNGNGSCKATWNKFNGEWKIISAEITFVPKVCSFSAWGDSQDRVFLSTS